MRWHPPRLAGCSRPRDRDRRLQRDPHLPLENSAVDGTTLVAEGAAKKVLVPTGPVSDSWKSDYGFNDSGWTNFTFVPGKTGGVGYETSSGYGPWISYDVQSGMYGGNCTCYIRIPFTVDAEELSSYTNLLLNIRFDDGYAYTSPISPKF